MYGAVHNLVEDGLNTATMNFADWGVFFSSVFGSCDRKLFVAYIFAMVWRCFIAFKLDWHVMVNFFCVCEYHFSSNENLCYATHMVDFPLVMTNDWPNSHHPDIFCCCTDLELLWNDAQPCNDLSSCRYVWLQWNPAQFQHRQVSFQLQFPQKCSIMLQIIWEVGMISFLYRWTWVSQNE